MNNIQIKKLNKYELFVFKHVKQFVCIRFFTKNRQYTIHTKQLELFLLLLNIV